MNDDYPTIDVDPSGEEPVKLSVATLAEAMGEEQAAEFLRAQGMDPDRLLDVFDVDKLAEIEMAGVRGNIKRQEGGAIFSDIHLQTAIELSRQVEAYEKVPPEDWGYKMNWGLVVSSVTSCVSFLDAIINEFADDISGTKVPNHAETVEDLENAGFDSDFKSLMTAMEDEDIIVWRHMSTLDKYQAILTLSEAERFDKGAMPYQDAYTLTRLRNYFIHFKPEMYEYNQKEVQHSLGSALEGKYDQNPLAEDYEPYFPHKALSHGCTGWAIECSLSFTDAFFEKFDLKPSYERRKDILDFEDYVPK